jgi:CheY-like chemotaxis protein
VTDSGRIVFESKDVAVPSDYRFILWMMAFHGQDHVEKLGSQFPEQLLADCLAEMAELGLIEQVSSAAEAGDAALSKTAVQRPSVLAIAQSELTAVNEALTGHGAYVSEERLKDLRASGKSPAKTTILRVEDDPDQLALADLRVSMAGYIVQVASSQATMLKSMAERGVPDLLLLDVMLPDGNGFEILKKLRTLGSFASLPIVMLTAKSEPADIVEGLRLGANGYITKPYSKNILALVVTRVLQPVN